MYPKETKTLTQKDICIFIFIAALFTIAKTWKQGKYPLTDKWIKKFQDVCKYVRTHARTHAHTQRNILFNHKKGENPTIFNNTDGPRRHYALISLICVTPPLKKKEETKNLHQTYRKKDQLCGYQMGGERAN